MLPDPVSEMLDPPFFSELEGPDPVVHVTQGTIANTQPDLIRPVLAALAQERVLIVVSTGGRSADELGLQGLPDNARVVPYLDYARFLPKVSVMITNGGYGGVQMALSQGIPLVVAGTTEDKPEVAARVAWSGAGINLHTASPSPEAVLGAVRRILNEPQFRANAQRLRAEYQRYNALDALLGCVNRTLLRPAVPTRSVSEDAQGPAPELSDPPCTGAALTADTTAAQ
jgi:UDP:flavonoid glycosyltransferase YjiC (YdhE family)